MENESYASFRPALSLTVFSCFPVVAGLERAALPVWGAEGGCSSEAVAGELPSALSFAVFLACSGIWL